MKNGALDNYSTHYVYPAFHHYDRNAYPSLIHVIIFSIQNRDINTTILKNKQNKQNKQKNIKSFMKS